MKTNKFMFILVLALFVMLPYGVSAEVKDFGDSVIVLDEKEITCDGYTNPYIEDEPYDENEVVVVFNRIYDDETGEYSGLYYLYNYETNKCTKTTNEEIEQNKNYNNIYYEMRDNKLYENNYVNEIYYEIKDNKLYEKKVRNMSIRDYYVLLTERDFQQNPNAQYYYSTNPYVFSEVENNDEIDLTSGNYYRKVALSPQVDLDKIDRYYVANPPLSAKEVEKNECETTGCYGEASIEDYKTITYLSDIDTSKFNFQEDGFDFNITDENVITDYIVLNNKKYLIIDDKHLYTIDGEYIDLNKDIDDGVITYCFELNDKEYFVIDDKQIYSVDGELVDLNKNLDIYSISIFGDDYLYIRYYEQEGENEFSHMRLYNSNFEVILSSDSLYSKRTTLDLLFENDNQPVLMKRDRNLKEYTLMFIRDYRLLEGKDQTYTDKDLVIKTNGDYNLLKNIEVDDIVLSSDNYTIESGSTIVTLKKDYLDTLDNGTYILRVEYIDGGYVETEFTVAKDTPTNPDEENPKTFDGIGTSIFMGTISLIGLVGATIYFKKRNRVRA